MKKVQKATKKVEHSQEFLEQKELIEMKRENDKLKHAYRMIENKYQRESDKIHNELEMERQRVRSAEIRKSIDRKAASKSNYNSNYSSYQP